MTKACRPELSLSGKLALGNRIVLNDDINHDNRNATAVLTLEATGEFDVMPLSHVGGSFFPVGTLTWTVAHAPGEVDVDALRRDLLPGGPLHDAAVRVVAGHNVQWDGNNLAACLTPDARAASEELDEFLSRDGSCYLTGREVVDAKAWLHESANDELTGDEGDDELEALAEEWEAEADRNGIVLAGDVLEMLQTIRDEKLANASHCEHDIATSQNA